MQVKVESASAACLEALRARHNVALESQAGIKRLKDRETDLRSYERRVAEGKAKANPKPEFIAKFTAKQENAAADVTSMTASVQRICALWKALSLSAPACFQSVLWCDRADVCTGEQATRHARKQVEWPGS